MWINVISGGITNARIHKGDDTANKTVTMNTGEGSFIDFNLGSDNTSWQVLISSSSDRSNPIWTYWGWGTPTTRQVSWNGYMSYYDYSLGYYRNEKAPKGNYYVRIQLGSGGIYDDSLSLTLQSLDISGYVRDEQGSGIADVMVSCYGPSYANTQTDAQGHYVLSGLLPGAYNMNFSKYGYSYCNASGVGAGDTKNVELKKPVLLRINAHRGVSSDAVDQEVWGNVQLVSATGSGTYYGGMLHFAVDVSTSDNGMWTCDATPRYEINNATGGVYDAGKWTTMEVSPGTYNLRADIYGYDTVERTVAITTHTAISDIVFSLKKTVSGGIVLSVPPAESWGTWISVEAIPEGGTQATGWGWVSIPYGSSSGTYTVFGLNAGNYSLRAFAPGYRRGKVPVTIGAGDIFKTVPDITLDAGGGLTGTITVDGDTTDSALNTYLSCDPYTLYLNAWSPNSYSYGWTQIPVAKNTGVATSTFTIRGLDDGTYWVNSWMYGFELQGATGWNGVKATVSNGAGNVNLTFKRYAGRIKCAFKVPNKDYANLKISVNGMNLWASDVPAASPTNGIMFDSATGIMTTPPLGTGFYQIKGEYTGTGLVKTKSIMAVNGQTKSMEIDLTAQTYTVSGTVSLSASNPPQGYTSIAVLVSSAPLVMVTENGSNYPANMNSISINGSYISTTTFRVTALDYTQMSSLSSPSVGGGTSPNAKTGIIDANGSFSITGLVQGVYLLQIPSLELDGLSSNGKETASVDKIVTVTGDVSDISLEVSKGYAVKGQVKLPVGETATRDFNLYVFKASKYKMGDWSSGGVGSWLVVSLVNANAKSFEFKGLAPGNYVVAVNDSGYWDNARSVWVQRQYANASLPFTIGAADLNLQQNLQLSKGGSITLKLRDADSGTLITPANRSKMLPQSYMISATANPWVEGGWGSVDNAGLSTISGTGGSVQSGFEMKFLPEASYDVLLGQSQYGMYGCMMGGGAGTPSSGGGNQTDYASKTLSAIKVRDGQTNDLGTIDIKQGVSVTGTVNDKNGAGIPNIPVVAVPSLSNEWSSELRGFTDINGKYSISGLNADYPYYDIIACPRVDARMLGDYFFFGAGGLTYGEKTRSMVKIKSGLPVDFTLVEAKGAVKGKVLTEDGGKMQNMNDPNLPTANVLMQLEDTFPRTNPVGDITADTQIDGTFSIEALAPGTYKLVVLAGGYASATRAVTVTDAEVDLGNITVKRGAKISGGITRLDKKNPSTSEIRNIVAATDDFSEILVGTLRLSGEKSVTGYELNGFQSGNAYNIMFLAEGDDLVPAAVNYSVPFSSYVKTDCDLVYNVAQPAVFSRSTRSGSAYTVYMELTGALRNSVPDDDDLSKLLTVTSGTGTLSAQYLAPNRKILSCVYTAPSGETRFALRLRGFAKALNPETGTEFAIDESFLYYAGVGAKNRVRVSNLRGGKVTLEGDSSNIQFRPGAFEATSSTATIYVDFTKGDSIDDLKNTAPGRGAPRMTISSPAPAYPDRLFQAMKTAQSAGVDPFSAFYDVMLPAGVSRVLKKDATLSLQYSGSVDPATLNIYYYDDVNRVYLLENKKKTTDSTEKTITVSVSHASVFVVLQANAAVIQGTVYNGPLFVYNYPNPFNLKTKSIALINATASQMNQTTDGTMLHYGLPTDISGAVEIKIYDVAGELVRTIDDGAKTGGSHYYTAWDGANDNGRKVASGVYIARFTVDKKHEKYFKMAVIK